MRLENKVFPGKDLTYKTNALIRAENIILFCLPGEGLEDAIVRINLETQGVIIKDLQTKMIINEPYRTDKKAQKRYSEILEKISKGKYELDLGLPGVRDPSIKFLD